MKPAPATIWHRCGVEISDPYENKKTTCVLSAHLTALKTKSGDQKTLYAWDDKLGKDKPPAPSTGDDSETKWLFTAADEPRFCVAGLWRPSPQGEAFSLLTTEPGPDVAPYHSRQVVVLRRSDWAGWLDGSATEAEVLQPLPAGSLRVARAA